MKRIWVTLNERTIENSKDGNIVNTLIGILSGHKKIEKNLDRCITKLYAVKLFVQQPSLAFLNVPNSHVKFYDCYDF